MLLTARLSVFSSLLYASISFLSLSTNMHFFFLSQFICQLILFEILFGVEISYHRSSIEDSPIEVCKCIRRFVKANENNTNRSDNKWKIHTYKKVKHMIFCQLFLPVIFNEDTHCILAILRCHHVDLQVLWINNAVFRRKTKTKYSQNKYPPYNNNSKLKAFFSDFFFQCLIDFIRSDQIDQAHYLCRRSSQPEKLKIPIKLEQSIKCLVFLQIPLFQISLNDNLLRQYRR